MNLNLAEYRSKVLGCWMGKNIGGTIGAPFEWRRQVNNVTFYTQDLAGEPLPNDDLDIQLLWLIALEERGIDINARTLAEYWVGYVTPHWAEYGTAKTHMRRGLVPPLTGTVNNDYKDSCGAFIRSEIWACIAPGNPRLAALYAYEDGILDHGNGEGMYAEVFCAALESAAFVVGDLRELIRIGLSYIPDDCGVTGAIKCAIAAHDSGKTYLEARDLILRDFRGCAFLNNLDHVSPEDIKKGFHTGKLGFDVPSNIGLLLVALLYGGEDFAKTLCVAVNCGEDTDCTAATAGAIFGIMRGIDAIPEKWIAPIGRKIKTACLNLGELGYFGNQLPADVDNLTARTERIARQVALRQRQLAVDLTDQPTDLKGLGDGHLLARDCMDSRYRDLGGPVYRFEFFDVALDYASDPSIRDNVPKSLTVRITNTYKVQASLNLRWYTPEGWQVSPSPIGTVFSVPWGQDKPLVATFGILAPRVPANINRLVLEITADGRPTAMLVPVVLTNGNVTAATPPA